MFYSHIQLRSKLFALRRSKPSRLWRSLAPPAQPGRMPQNCRRPPTHRDRHAPNSPVRKSTHRRFSSLSRRFLCVAVPLFNHRKVCIPVTTPNDPPESTSRTISHDRFPGRARFLGCFGPLRPPRDRRFQRPDGRIHLLRTTAPQFLFLQPGLPSDIQSVGMLYNASRGSHNQLQVQ